MPSRAAPTDAPFVRVRFVILGGVVAAAFTAYLERRAIAVAGAQMMPALGIGEIELGYLFNAFLFTYTLLQYPGGLLAQRIGARRLTTACLVVSTLGTALTALIPGLVGPLIAFLGVGLAQALVGIGQGPLFPANAGIVQAWFAPRHWALMNGLQVTGLSLGAAAAPPLIAALMQTYGWRNALYATCVPALVLALGWSWYVRNRPREHPAMTPAELAEIEPEPRATTAPRVSWAEVRRLLGDRNVLVLSVGYLLMNYVFYFFNQWSFLYLVEERHLALLKSGWLASIPLLIGAICATVGGVLCGAACRRLGARRGFRLVPLVVLPLSGALLLVAARADDAYVAVAALAGCFGCVQMTESAFWGATFWAARERAAAATGVLNMFGNIGGIIGTPIVAWFAHAHQWPAALATGVAFALASALLWLWVDVERRPAQATA